MDKIKSAREIALEKAARLGKASPEELRQIREREFAPVGEALAVRYLSGACAWREVEGRIAKSGEARDIVAGAVLAKLIASVGPGDNSTALAGIESLARDKEQMRAIGRRLHALSETFRERRQQQVLSLKQEVEQTARQELEQAGISGTAVRIAAEHSPQWRQMEAGLEAEYNRDLDRARQELQSAAQPHRVAHHKEKP